MPGANPQTVNDLLRGLRGLEPLKKLFWTELNYGRVNKPLGRRGWPESASHALAEDPTLLAAGGQDNAFEVIYARLTDRLLLGQERPVVSRLLQDHPYALFIFSNRAQDRWHFLNVKYDKETAKRRMFRRISVGPEERLRTASERIALLDLASVSADLFGLSPLAIQTRHDEAFDVEAVTDEFFKKYAEVFGKVEKAIEGIAGERKRLFTQRLFNRLMFIAFIQKKGWLNYNGDTNYLSALWDEYQTNTKARASHSRESGNPSVRNFYADRLKRLFFHGLSTAGEVDIIGINRGGDLGAAIGKVPYLNGGLFEEDEDDKNSKIRVPDEAIDAVVNGLFGHFNFTVMESTPLDVEVAVDPEMLGKVFEELVTGRHETGSYYTPKPVVSFMCREALKGYLTSKLSGVEQSSSPFRPHRQSDIGGSLDSRLRGNDHGSGKDSDSSFPRRRESIENFVDQHDPSGLTDAEAVLEALRKVKVCDPACGSGAYLLGMLHELLDLRACLFATSKLDAISNFERKLEIIQKNLYGVDLDEFAVNIARLRLWLSLAVEYEGDNPPPLPNLDFKIETGDSLTVSAPSGGLEQGFRKPLLDEYLKLKAEFLTAHHGHKIELRKRIGKIRETIHGWAHTGSAVDGFDWAVEFTEVFSDGGFDVVLANPPYVRQELIKQFKPKLQQLFPSVYSGATDLYCYFYVRGIQLLRPSGMLSFISSNKWFRTTYGAKLRKHISETCWIQSITDFGDLPVFESATSYPMIFVGQKLAELGHLPLRAPIFTQVKSLDPPYPDVLAVVQKLGRTLGPEAVNGARWVLTDLAAGTFLRKVETKGIPLGEYVKGQIHYGVKTGFNTAFVIDATKRAELIARDSKCAEIIRPLVLGRDIHKWRLDNKDRSLIVTPVGVNIRHYPVIFSHLKRWERELEARCDKGNHWWELRPCAYYHAFEGPKIVWGNLGLEPAFSYSASPLYTVAPANIIPTSDLYLLGLLNSSTSKRFFDETSIQRSGNYLEFKPVYVKQLPIPDAPSAERAAIAALAQKCLDAKGVGCEKWEAEINERVAALYGL